MGVNHLQFIDHFASLFPEHEIIIVGLEQLGAFGTYSSSNIEVRKISLKDVNSDEFDLMIDVYEARCNCHPEDYEGIVKKWNIPRVYKQLFYYATQDKFKPENLENTMKYFKDVGSYPVVLEAHTQEQIYHLPKQRVIWHSAPLWYNTKWIGNEKKAMSSLNFYYAGRQSPTDADLYQYLQQTIPSKFYIHDGNRERLNEHELVKLYSSSRIYVEGSTFRPINYCFFQALSIGIPFVWLYTPMKQTDYGRLILDNVNGKIVKSFQEAKEAIEYLLEHEEECKTLSEGQRKIANIYISPKVIRKQWEETFTEAFDYYNGKDKK